MDQWIIIGMVVVILVFGSLAAMFWWRLAARIKPYKDEAGRAVAREDEHVVIIKSGDAGHPDGGK
jgi:hypothetical protein